MLEEQRREQQREERRRREVQKVRGKVLGDLERDRRFIERLIDERSYVLPANETFWPQNDEIEQEAYSVLEYLDQRQEFWAQRNPTVIVQSAKKLERGERRQQPSAATLIEKNAGAKGDAAGESADATDSSKSLTRPKAAGKGRHQTHRSDEEKTTVIDETPAVKSEPITPGAAVGSTVSATSTLGAASVTAMEVADESNVDEPDVVEEAAAEVIARAISYAQRLTQEEEDEDFMDDATTAPYDDDEYTEDEQPESTMGEEHNNDGDDVRLPEDEATEEMEYAVANASNPSTPRGDAGADYDDEDFDDRSDAERQDFDLGLADDDDDVIVGIGDGGQQAVRLSRGSYAEDHERRSTQQSQPTRNNTLGRSASGPAPVSWGSPALNSDEAGDDRQLDEQKRSGTDYFPPGSLSFEPEESEQDDEQV